MNNNQEWLDNLKEGDQVAVSNRSWYSLDTIKRITPTGIIRTENGWSFNKDGWERGDSWNNKRLEPITDKILEHVEKDKLLRDIKDTKFHDLPLEALRNIYKAIKGS